MANTPGESRPMHPLDSLLCQRTCPFGQPAAQLTKGTQPDLFSYTLTLSASDLHGDSDGEDGFILAQTSLRHLQARTCSRLGAQPSPAPMLRSRTRTCSHTRKNAPAIGRQNLLVSTHGRPEPERAYSIFTNKHQNSDANHEISHIGESERKNKLLLPQVRSKQTCANSCDGVTYSCISLREHYYD